MRSAPRHGARSGVRWVFIPAAVAAVLSSAFLGCGTEEVPDVPFLPTLGPEGTVVVDGANLSYMTAGTGPAVIVLHGGPGLGAGYLLPELANPLIPADRFRWIVYDQRASGRSSGADRPELITLERFVEDLDTIRRAAREERVVLLAHGFGALLALRYAAKYPAHVRGLMLLDPYPATREDWAASRAVVEARTTREDRARLEEITATEDWSLDPRLEEEYYVTRFRAYFGRRQAADRLRLGLSVTAFGNYPGTAERMLESLGSWDLRGVLPEVTAPVLILTGTESIFPGEAHRKLAEALPRGRLEVLPGVGHFPHMEAPDVFARLLTTFLDEVTGG